MTMCPPKHLRFVAEYTNSTHSGMPVLQTLIPCFKQALWVKTAVGPMPFREL